MDDQHSEFSVAALIENARKRTLDRDFAEAYAAHVRRKMAATQREIDEAMILNPDLRDMRL
ncbi:hypothetical protein [Caulobacter sp. FWC2]|uniref:hypothetical protein n=1 Tax=Caulobacter sp. FWC2 TaxID=69664 RepID=UPI000C14E0EB|nr:hypothetical protein [Caulobacter sp. FWC2]PIB93105.1 hypothetical protein CSW62_16875 [Caulobacter sp. FWC2]